MSDTSPVASLAQSPELPAVTQPIPKAAITYDDFSKLDVRVGTVIEATAPDWSRKLLRLVVDFGTDIGQRIIFSGIRQWYAPEDVVTKQFMFIVNLAPKKMGSEFSQGMMLMADAADRPTLEPLSTQVAPGTTIR